MPCCNCKKHYTTSSVTTTSTLMKLNISTTDSFTNHEKFLVTIGQVLPTTTTPLTVQLVINSTVITVIKCNASFLKSDRIRSGKTYEFEIATDSNIAIVNCVNLCPVCCNQQPVVKFATSVASSDE